MLACLLLLVDVYTGHTQPPPLVLSFNAPGSNQPVDSVFTVQVTCYNQTAYAITSIVATLQGQSTVLTSSGQFTYSGTVSLVGLPKESAYTLTVEAKDAGGDSSIINEAVIYDPPPVVTLIQPVWGAVGRPTINVKATCAATAGHCQLAVVIINGTADQTVGTFTDSVTTTVDVSAYEGSGNLQLDVTGTDQYNVQSLLQGVDFYVETSPYLTPLYSANNPITGFLGNNMLVDNLLYTASPQIVNYTTGVVTTVPFKGNIPYTGGEFLTSTGMAFIGQRDNQAGVPAGYPVFYTWNNETLDSLSMGGSQVSGNYTAGLGGSPGPLYITNLTTKTTQWIDDGWLNFNLDSSGAIAYTNNPIGGADDSVLLYKNGITIPVRIQADDTLVTDAITDGKNVVYLQQDRFYNKTIYRYDAKTGTNNLLSYLGNPSLPGNFPDYAIGNGYTAYLKSDASSQFQAWIRDTSGNNTQVSFFNWNANLERLAPNGQLAFQDLDAANTSLVVRYIYDKTAGLTPISSALGTPYYQGTNWYVVIGNTLFGVNLTINPDKADSFAVNAKEDSLYTFAINDFASHYQTSGSLMSVTIAKLPTHGTLKLSGTAVFAGQVIPRSSLATLVYTPALNFVGSDTARWSGSNGFTSSPDTALLVINVDSLIPTLPPAPQISGLPPGYCSNLGVPQHFNVANMPEAGIGTTVAATINGQPVTVAGNGAISIQPWTMQVGTYTVVVIFTNSVGADTTTANFQIVQASTPIVTLSATPSVLTPSTRQVVLTATDVSGGGTSPLYTFSTDYSFNSNILQAESDSNTMTIAVSSLVADSTVIYVRMKTSDTCATSSIGVDQVLLIKPLDTTATPPTDTTGTSGAIVVGPNPFTSELILSGMDPTKSYVYNIVNALGQVVIPGETQGLRSVVLMTGYLQRGIYYLRVYDAQSGRVITGKALLKVD